MNDREWSISSSHKATDVTLSFPEQIQIQGHNLLKNTLKHKLNHKRQSGRAGVFFERHGYFERSRRLPQKGKSDPKWRNEEVPRYNKDALY